MNWYSNNCFSVGEVFQFFVRATDKGRPEKHSDVPVNILIIGPNDIPPSFEKSEGKFFLPENSATGTLIAKLKMVSNLSVNFEIGKSIHHEDIRLFYHSLFSNVCVVPLG